MACVGIVGGLGVGATVHYYEQIAALCKARGTSPDLVIVHADVDRGQGFVREGKLDALADYLAGFIERLGGAGATAAVLPAVTPHICIAQLAPRTSLPLINIVDPIAAELRARGVRRVALFGTTFTMEGSLWGQLSGVEIAMFDGRPVYRFSSGNGSPLVFADDGSKLEKFPDDLLLRLAAAWTRQPAAAAV